MKQRGPLMELEPMTSTLRFRRATHWATRFLSDKIVEHYCYYIKKECSDSILDVDKHLKQFNKEKSEENRSNMTSARSKFKTIIRNKKLKYEQSQQ